MNKSFKDHKFLKSSKLIFLLIASLYAVSNFIWWMINTPVIPIGISALHFSDIFSGTWLMYNAPLLTWIMRGMFFIFGKEYFDLIIIFINYVFFIISLYFIYKIGTELKDKQTGSIAMILFSLVPAVYAFSRHYGHQDYHLIGAITFNIYCLIKSDYFRNRKWSFIYGVSAGLGLMIKDPFLVYFIMPFAYIVFKGIKDKQTGFVNVLFAVLSGSVISGWHYFRPEIIKKILYEPVTETAPVFEFESLRVMTTGLWEELLSPPIFIIFIIGLIWFIHRYKSEYKHVILLWFFVPWAVIMFMPHFKIAEYGLGFIPAVVLIASSWVSDIKKIHIRKFIVFFAISTGFLQYASFSYGINSLPLFDAKLKIGRYPISYYDRNIFSDSSSLKEDKNIILLGKFISNYKDKTIFVNCNFDFNKDMLVVYSCLYCPTLKLKFDTWHEIVSLDDVDIIICFDPISDEKHAEIREFYNKVHPLNRRIKNIEKNLTELKQNLSDRKNNIAANFELKNSFYIDKDNKDTEVSVFEKK